MVELIAVCAGFVTVAGAVAVFVKILMSLKRLGNFVDDWNGEPDRPGVPGRPGVMERLVSIESEVRTNHGSSLKDAVNRIEHGLNELRDEFSDHLKNQADVTISVNNQHP